MNLIKVSDIRISETRQRRVFDPSALNELRESIITNGLFHPPVLREEGGKFILVAGERRLRAIADIYDLGDTFKCDNESVDIGYTPYVTLGELGELEREEAELDENIKRTDLSWTEKATATARLSELRKKQAIATNSPLPTHIDIAEEIRGSSEGRAREAIRRELIVSQHLHKPEIAAAKTMDEAFKLLKKEESEAKNRDIAEKVGRTFTSAVHRLFHADCTKWLYSCPNNSFDVILTDPPYGMGADEFGDSGGKAEGAHGYKDDKETFLTVVGTFVAESFRVAKPQAHAYIFCDLDNFHELKKWMIDAGWEVHRTPLVWYKPSGNRIPWVNYGPQRQYELILYAVKGKKNCNIIAPDVLIHRSDMNLGHSAQKPVALLIELLKRSVRAGDSIFDPFMGTGSTVAAGHELKCTVTGVEMDSNSYGIAVLRVQSLK